MKIIIKQEPEVYEDMLDEETTNYTLNATYDIPNSCTATEAATVFFKAMLTEGYYPSSIIKAFVEVADYQLDTLQSIAKGLNTCHCDNCYCEDEDDDYLDEHPCSYSEW